MTDNGRVALVGATIIDGLGGPARQGEAVLVEQGRIIDVLPQAQLPADYPRLDLAGKTLLPGLIDAHVHLLGQRSMDNREMTFVGEGLRAARATADLRRLLEAGITTVRDCGSYTALALKTAVAEGSIPGPRIVACGRFIERTGGADDAPYMPVAWANRADPGRPGWRMGWRRCARRCESRCATARLDQDLYHRSHHDAGPQPSRSAGVVGRGDRSHRR